MPEKAPGRASDRRRVGKEDEMRDMLTTAARRVMSMGLVPQALAVNFRPEVIEAEHLMSQATCALN